MTNQVTLRPVTLMILTSTYANPLDGGQLEDVEDGFETAAFFEKFIPLVAQSTHCEIVVCPAFVSLAAAVDAAKGSRIGIGGQNLHWEKEGAFTGEISGLMLKSIGAQWVIVGHSERRQYFGETNDTVLRRTAAALSRVRT